MTWDSLKLPHPVLAQPGKIKGKWTCDSPQEGALAQKRRLRKVGSWHGLTSDMIKA